MGLRVWGVGIKGVAKVKRAPRGLSPLDLICVFRVYRGTLLIRKRLPLGPYSRTMPRALWWC